MRLFAVRHSDDKQAVGFFWVYDTEELVIEVDSITEVDRCEFQEMRGPASFVWDSPCPGLGVDRKDDDFGEEYRSLIRAMEPEGEFLPYFYDDTGDDWMLLQFRGEEKARLMSRRPKPKKAKAPDVAPAPKRQTKTLFEAMNNVYFIECGGHIKIGVTSSVEKRLKALSTGHHQELTLLAVIKDAPDDLEYSLHQQFAALRVRGEWFRAEPELLAYIETVKAPK